jgi:hypothetical protein
MSHWKNANINLGVIQAGKAKKITFEALPNIPEIVSITPGCGCTSTDYNKKTKELIVIYSNSKIPNQVQAPAQTISKSIYITYDTGLSEVLTIKATRTR